MVFAKRQAAALAKEGVLNCNFFLATRTSPWGLWTEFRRFCLEIRQFQPDLVHAHFGTVTALFCAIATGLPLVITFRGSDLNPCPSMPWLRSALGRAFSHVAAVRARSVLCVSEQLRQRLCWRRRRIYVMPTGVDTDIFYPRPSAEARRQLGWATDDRIVLFNAGRTPAVKRLDLAEASVADARRHGQDIRLVVLDGSVDPGKLPLMMNAADCLLVTSDWEGSPTVVQEAMACNLPVISVDVGDVRDRLRGVKPSAIVPRDSVAISNAIVALISPPRRSNGWCGAKKVSLDVITPLLVDIYQETACAQDDAIERAPRELVAVRQHS